MTQEPEDVFFISLHAAEMHAGMESCCFCKASRRIFRLPGILKTIAAKWCGSRLSGKDCRVFFVLNMKGPGAQMKNNSLIPDFRPLAAALQFLTILPIPAAVSEADMKQSLPWFPAAGFVCGAGAGLVFLAAHGLGFPAMMAGLMAVLALSGFNGFFHADGVADTADGFWSARPREQVLEIMRDSRIGTMGVIGLIAVLGLKWSALSAIGPGDGFRALIVAAVVARSAQVITMGIAPYARKEGGLASVFLSERAPHHMAIAAISGLLLAAAVGGIAGIAGLLAAIAAAFGFNSLCMKKIGGITGDTLGALTEITETVVLCTMCILLL